MDITNTSKERVQLAIERFLLGEFIEYEGCIFKIYMNKLCVSCFSNFHSTHPNIKEESKLKFQEAKDALEHLKDISPNFNQKTQNLSVELSFCLDYGKGGVLMAKEVDGHLEWFGK